MRILAMSGSLRAASSNTAVILAAQSLAPSEAEIVVYEGLGTLPFFNPDLADDAVLPPAVRAFRQMAVESAGLLICSPEYARGVAGVLKNGLDWLVGAEHLAGTPCMVVNASPRATSADAHLKLTLETMTLPVVEAACITLPLLGRGLSGAGILADAELRTRLAQALARFVDAIAAGPARDDGFAP